MVKPAQIKSYPDNHFHDLTYSVHANFEDARRLARELSGHAFSNLDDYPFVYFTAGATEAIDFTVRSAKNVQVSKGEYRYVFGHREVSLDEAPTSYLSFPFSGTGQYTKIPESQQVILDCSYVFATAFRQQTLPKNVLHPIFGVSKSHNLAHARCGWFFSRTVIPTYHVLQYDYDYGGSMHHAVLERISHEAPNFLFKKYEQEFSALYAQHKLEEPQTNLFGLTRGVRVPYYKLDDRYII